MLDRNFLKGVREQLAAIEREITGLQAHRTALAHLLGSINGPAPKPCPAVKAALASAPTPTTTVSSAGGRVRKNYIGLALAEIGRCGGSMSVSAIRAYLATLPGLESVTVNNLNAAIQNEQKKGAAARIVRISPGVYALAGVAHDTPDAPEQQEAESEPIAEGQGY